jgi:nitrite reductase (NO-forming)
MTAVASFALVALTACGGEQAHEDVTRVPTMSDAAAQATRDAANAPAATPGAEGATPAAGATPVAGDETAAAAMSVDVVSHDIFFEPSEVTIPANTDVTVNLPNEGVTPHNFSIDTLGIDVDIAPGATEETVINAPAGEYEYYCNVPGHKQAGMVGTLTVG